MDGLIPEKFKVVIYWFAWVEYVRKGRQGEQNIQFQNNCNHQEDQSAPFHTQAAREKFCPIEGSELHLMASLQGRVFT